MAGVGFFTDAYVCLIISAVSLHEAFSSYDIFAIIIAATMIGLVYGSDLDQNHLRAPTPYLLVLITLANLLYIGQLTQWQSAGLKMATPVGNLVGQLLFGWLADILGRKRMCE